jgi:hypothetical protein
MAARAALMAALGLALVGVTAAPAFTLTQDRDLSVQDRDLSVQDRDLSVQDRDL